MRKVAARVGVWFIDRWGRLWATGLRPGSPGGIAFALACICLATAIRILVGEVGPESAAFAPYYSATLVIAFVCGWASAAISALAGGILAYLLFLLPDKDLTRSTTVVISLGLYGASSIVIIWSAESYRRLLLLLEERDKLRTLFSDELAHRVKNTLAVVQNVIRRSIPDQPELRKRLCDRIAALADTNDILMHAQDVSTFSGLIERELAHFGSSRVHVSGPDFSCSRETLTLLSLVVHELATNAAKHGAFATAAGSLYLDWSIVCGRLALEWRECGVAGIGELRSKGSGSKLLDAVVRRLGGSVDFELADGGITCRLTLQLFEPDDSDSFAGMIPDHQDLPLSPASS